MNVALPDGTVLNDVPDGTTRAQIAEKLKANGRDVPAEWMAPPAAKTPEAPGFLKQARGILESTGPIGAGASAMLPGDPVSGPGKFARKAFEAPEKYADLAGEKVSEATGSPLAGAATKTGLIGATMLTPGGEAKGAQVGAREAFKRAEAYVSQHTSLDWNALASGFKEKLVAIAKEGAGLSRLDPKAVERVGRAQALNLPVTRGQATRNLSQITQEENLQRTEAGQPLRDIQSQQDIGLHGHLDTLRTKTGAQAETRLQLGESVQGAARAKYKAARASYTKKYQAARDAGETAGPVDTTPLHDFLNVPAHDRNLGFLKKAIADYQKDPSGSMRINDLEEIRKEVTAASQSSDGTTRHYAGEAKKVIDEILDNAGGDLYKAARKAFRDTKEEFDRQSLVKKLVGEKGKSSDRAVAVEDTFHTVVRQGSKEQLQGLIKSLTTGGTVKTRKLGDQAVSDLRGATIDYLKEAAAGKRGVRGEQEQQQFNSSFINAVDELDKDGKLDVLFPKEARDVIRQIREVTRDLRTKPADRIAGPNTAPRLIAALEKLSNIPLVGHVLGGTAKVVGKLHAMGKEGREVRQATTTPLDEAAQAVSGNKGQTLRSLRRVAPAAGITLQDNE